MPCYYTSGSSPTNYRIQQVGISLNYISKTVKITSMLNLLYRGTIWQTKVMCLQNANILVSLKENVYESRFARLRLGYSSSQKFVKFTSF